jgi:hypothetical protein
VVVVTSEGSNVERVSLSRAARWKRKRAYYRTTRGDLCPVVCVEKKRPNWRIVLEDGRDFLVDPKTLLVAD